MYPRPEVTTTAPQDARSQPRNYPNVTTPQQEKGSSARYTGIVPLFLLPIESEQEGGALWQGSSVKPSMI